MKNLIDISTPYTFTMNTVTNNFTIKSTSLTAGSKFSTSKTTGTISLQKGANLETDNRDTLATNVYLKLTNLDQQNLLVTDQQNPSSPVKIPNLTNQYGTLKTPTLDLLIILLQRTEAVLNSANGKELPVPTVNVTTTTITRPTSEDNKNIKIAILMQDSCKTNRNAKAY